MRLLHLPLYSHDSWFKQLSSYEASIVTYNSHDILRQLCHNYAWLCYTYDSVEPGQYCHKNGHEDMHAYKLLHSHDIVSGNSCLCHCSCHHCDMASECSSKFAKIIIGKGNPVAVLATMILISCAKLFKAILTSFSLLYWQIIHLSWVTVVVQPCAVSSQKACYKFTAWAEQITMLLVHVHGVY